jgi:hypothetical protein
MGKWEQNIFFFFSTENFEGKCITFLSGDPLLKMFSIILSYPKSRRKENLLGWPSKVLKAVPFWPADFFFFQSDRWKAIIIMKKRRYKSKLSCKKESKKKEKRIS